MTSPAATQQEESRLVHGSREFSIDVPWTVVLPEGYEAGGDCRYPLVVSLHGQGQNEESLRETFAPLFDRPWIWLFPRGVFPHEVRGRMARRIGYAWYTFDGDQVALRGSMGRTQRHLLKLLDDVQEKVRTDSGRVALVGFSQGGYLAGVVGPYSPERFRGAASLGGRIKHEFLKEAAIETGGRFALAQFHGGRDTTVSPEAARDSLGECRRMGFSDITWFEDTSAGHEVSPPMVEALGDWLARLFAGPSAGGP